MNYGTEHGYGVLGHEKILELLKSGKIFKEKTWTEENIRAAGYDLRVAHDFLIVPRYGHNEYGEKSHNYPHFERYRKGELKKDPIILNPGDVAFLSTEEKLCLPWNIAANIGIKFGLARQGILVLTGLLVDPGYGLEPDGKDSWRPKEDERIHFLVANVGSKPVSLKPGIEKIASLQFFKVLGKSEEKYVESGKDMEQEFFSENRQIEPSLIFFKHATETKQKVEELDKIITIAEKSTERIVTFGVFLLSATFLAISLGFVLSIYSSSPLVSNLNKLIAIMPTTWPQALLLLGTVGLLAIVTILIYRSFVMYLDKKFKSMSGR